MFFEVCDSSRTIGWSRLLYRSLQLEDIRAERLARIGGSYGIYIGASSAHCCLQYLLGELKGTRRAPLGAGLWLQFWFILFWSRNLIEASRGFHINVHWPYTLLSRYRILPCTSDRMNLYYYTGPTIQFMNCMIISYWPRNAINPTLGNTPCTAVHYPHLAFAQCDYKYRIFAVTVYRIRSTTPIYRATRATTDAVDLAQRPVLSLGQRHDPLKAEIYWA